MDTEDETNRRPTAIVRGFFSGFASETMARKDDALLEGFSPDETSLDSRDRFGLGAVPGSREDATSGELGSWKSADVEQNHLECGESRGGRVNIGLWGVLCSG